MAAPAGAPTSLPNYIIMKNIQESDKDIYAKNLVVFPGVTAEFTRVKIKVEENIVILGTMNIDSCHVVSNNVFNGFGGTLKDLHQKIGFTGDEIIELLEAMKKKD